MLCVCVVCVCVLLHLACRAIQQQYFAEMERVSFRLLEAFALGLGLPPKALHPLFETRHGSFLRLNYYPVTPHAPADALGISEHKDAGFLTVLLQDEVPGLQVSQENSLKSVAVRAAGTRTFKLCAP